MNINNPEFWQEKYTANNIPWDTKTTTPALINSIDHSESKKIAILGCGYSKDSIFLAKKSHSVYAVDFAGNSSNYSTILDATALSNEDLKVPSRFLLHQNYPNPFNPITRINYDMSSDGNALIKIIDIKGNQIKTLVNDFVQMGPKSIVWDATNNNGEKVPSGIYFYTLKVNDYLQTQKMVLLK